MSIERPTLDAEINVGLFQECSFIPYSERNLEQKIICRAKEIANESEFTFEAYENDEGNLVYEIPVSYLQQAWDQIFGSKQVKEDDEEDDDEDEDEESSEEESDSD